MQLHFVAVNEQHACVLHRAERRSTKDETFELPVNQQGEIPMKDCRQFYIDGKWVNPAKAHDFPVINPANEQPIATISLGAPADVDKAVAAARKAFSSY